MYINLFFRILNFVVLIGIIVFLLKRKFLAVIYEQIKEKSANFIKLMQKEQAVEQQIENVITSIEQERELMDRLKNNVNQWNALHEKKKEKEAQRKKEIQRELQEKVELQMLNKAKQRLRKKIIPSVLQKASIELKEQFSDKKEQDQYVGNIISHFKKHQQ